MRISELFTVVGILTTSWSAVAQPARQAPERFWPAPSVVEPVEFYNFFDELVRVEATALSPATLGSGHVAGLRAVTPYSEAVRKIRYRFTWSRGGERFQLVEKRDIWMIGSPTRASGRHHW